MLMLNTYIKGVLILYTVTASQDLDAQSRLGSTSSLAKEAVIDGLNFSVKYRHAHILSGRISLIYKIMQSRISVPLEPLVKQNTPQENML